MQYAWCKKHENSRYTHAFTVSESEFIDYILENGIPENEIERNKSVAEGFQFYKEDCKWHIYFYERRITAEDKNFDGDVGDNKHIARTLFKLAET